MVKYIYDPWGKVLSTTGSLASTLGTVQPFRYRGYVYDVETEFYYLRSRYYNPKWQRFINADSICVINMFCYCDNAPINYVDENGNDKETAYDEIYNPMVEQYPLLDSKKPGFHTKKDKMSTSEFIAHLWQAFKDTKWVYSTSGAQYRSTDCVGLYKMIMEWYYDKSTFKSLTTIAVGDKNKIGKKFNQVYDMINNGIENGMDGLYGVCRCCYDMPIGAAVFCFEDDPEKNKKIDTNYGWTHVGYYIGNGLIVEALSEDSGMNLSTIFDSKWDYWGYLKGINYGK